MKVLIATVLSILILSIPVTARELRSPGILPDNPFYSVKIFFEKVRLTFTFNPEAKARLHTSLAEQRLAELNATIEKGKLQYVGRLKRDYENEINESEKTLKKIEGLGRNTTTLAEHICNMTYKHISVLEEVLDKVPKQAQPAIEHVINVSMEKHENCIERFLAKWNKTEQELKWRFNCTADTDCSNLECPELKCAEARCPTFEPTCVIPLDKAKGVCMCMPKIDETFLRLPKRFSCTADIDCSNILSCPTFMQPNCYVTHNMTKGICICMPISCESDTDCSKLNCTGDRQSVCIIPKNKTKGFCFCSSINCTADFDCRKLICPMAIGHDTPICDDGRCRCGGKWELVNKTEWKERFKEEWTNATQKINEKLRERFGKGRACAQVITYKIIGGQCFECPDACSPVENCRNVSQRFCHSTGALIKNVS